MGKYDIYRSQIQFDVPATMQALIAKGVGFENLEVAEIPVPKINPNQLLARVDAAGVCTSILKLIDQGPDHIFIRNYPIWSINIRMHLGIFTEIIQYWSPAVIQIRVR